MLSRAGAAPMFGAGSDGAFIGDAACAAGVGVTAAPLRVNDVLPGVAVNAPRAVDDVLGVTDTG